MHFAINQSANLCRLQPGSVDYGKWEFSFVHISQILSVLLTDFANRMNQKQASGLDSFQIFPSLYHSLPFFHSPTLHCFGALQTCHNFLGKNCSDLSKWLKLSSTGITPGLCGQSEWECAIVQNILENALRNSSQVTSRAWGVVLGGKQWQSLI